MADYWLLGGLGSAAISAMFYAVYKHKRDTIYALENAVRIETAEQLFRALADSKEQKLEYAAVSGTANSFGADQIQSQYAKGVTGLMQTLQTLEYKTEWSKFIKEWHDTTRTISRTSNSVPFKLFNGKEVAVAEPFDAQGLDMKVIHDKFEPADSNLGKSIVDWASGDKVKGYRFIEEMLLPGTYLTGIGEITLSPDGKEVKLRPPSNGLPYFLTQSSVEELVKQYKPGKKAWMVLSFVFGIGGGVLLCIALYKYYKWRRERAENEALFQAMQEEGRISASLPGEEDNPGTLCIVCMDNPRNVVLLNCGHVCLCRPCAQQVNLCPICRSDIVRLVPIYQS